MEAEDSSASKSELEKPLSTPDMSAQDAEAMANSMLRDSPLPNLERGNEEIPEGDGSNKFQKGEKAKSFLREALMNSPRRPLQVSL